MRADRLIATVLLMQRRGRVTAAELAAELEVSVATARRDLGALAAAGVPVYPQPGRGGGWALVGGARTDLSGLSADEAQALFLLAGPAATISAEARSALRKLVRALPSTFRDRAEAAAAATLVDPRRWGDRDRTRPDHVESLQRAVVERRVVQFSYVSGARRPSRRTVEPWGLIDKDDLWYLVAGTERGRRTFRLDRISRVELTGSVFVPPPDFDLDAAWREIVGEVEGLRSSLAAVVLIETRWVAILTAQFGRHAHVEQEQSDGRSRVRLQAPTALDIARQLAGWGEAVEVVEPLEVRAELARIGSELTARYG